MSVCVSAYEYVCASVCVVSICRSVGVYVMLVNMSECGRWVWTVCTHVHMCVFVGEARLREVILLSKVNPFSEWQTGAWQVSYHEL